MNNKIDQIASEVKTCQLCPLYQKATQGVPGEGNSSARVFFIGEGPGQEEDKQGRPFVGQAGKFLEEMLGLIGWKREDVFIGNIVKHRPPGNRDPLPEEIDACWPYLDAQLEAIKPKLIVLLGRHAMYRFLPSDFRISKEHGKIFRRQGKFITPLYHPAAALYHGGLRQTLIQDFKKLPKMLAKIDSLATGG
ncbi:MAG: uracil-DNA glycosylase [Patescibacteria group bacterium]|nr:uracil-DNA glycosylase [Patescibacteria group bacterium]